MASSSKSGASSCTAASAAGGRASLSTFTSSRQFVCSTNTERRQQERPWSSERSVAACVEPEGPTGHDGLTERTGQGPQLGAGVVAESGVGAHRQPVGGVLHLLALGGAGWGQAQVLTVGQPASGSHGLDAGGPLLVGPGPGRFEH